MAKYFELILPDRAWFPLPQSQISDQRTEGIREDSHCLAFLSILTESTSSSGTLKQFKAKQKH